MEHTSTAQSTNTRSPALQVAASVFPHDIHRAPRRWAEQWHPNLIHWNELRRGGHSAAWEQPAPFAQEMRDGSRALRQAAA